MPFQGPEPVSGALSSTEYQQFNQLALHVRPEHDGSVHSFWVAVLPLGCDPLAQNATHVYKWIKCKPSTRFSKIKPAVEGQCSLVKGEYVFDVWGSEPADEEEVGKHDHAKNGVLAIRVLPKYRTPEPQTGRRALQDISGNVASPPAAVNATVIEKPRLSIETTLQQQANQQPDTRVQEWAAQTADYLVQPPSRPAKPADNPSTSSLSSIATSSAPASNPPNQNSALTGPSPTSPDLATNSAPAAKLYTDAKDALAQHLVMAGRQLPDGYTAATFAESLWHILRPNQHQSYEYIAALSVSPPQITNALRKWNTAAASGQKPTFNYHVPENTSADNGDDEAEKDQQPDMTFDNYFQEDTQQTVIDQRELPRSFELQSLVASDNCDQVESLLEQGTQYLRLLKKPFHDKYNQSNEAQQWVSSIEKLEQQAVRTRIIIGVVGDTASGKSSMINAMLDEERLVPVNSMRACTAVVTELSYNYEDGAPYRAEIEFISSDSWEAELKVLFADLIDPSGQVSKDCTDEKSEAGVAYAKIKAVYPHKTKDDIAKSSVAAMINGMKHILGTTRKLKNDDATRFYSQLQLYVDSKEKVNNHKKKKDAQPSTEFWPLIKVVRIYTRATALATGAVIVDLPGVHDANAARAAVAESYLKHCTGLWIVAPIIRAVDNQAAKHLLGESFKRQLKLDGGYNNVTFICSKTDDISITEVKDSLYDEDLFDALDDAKKRQAAIKPELADPKEELQVRDNVTRGLTKQREEWMALQDSIDEGEEVFAPRARSKSTKSKKRKAGKVNGRSRKKPRISDDSDNDFIVDDYEESDDESEPASEDEDPEDDIDDDDDADPHQDQDRTREPLTADQIKAKLTDIRELKKEAMNSKNIIKDKIIEVNKKGRDIKEEIFRLTSSISRQCIDGRNAYSTTSIQQDFAAGMKELDMEIAQEEDEENFNPDEDIRDYDEVARSLPVFCISARGYQKLSGRMKNDADVPGFDNIDQTNIPSLQAHCRRLTVDGRLAACRAFLTNLSQLLNSLTIWADVDGAVQLSDADKKREQTQLTKNLEKLEHGFEQIVDNLGNDINTELSDNVFEKYDIGVQAATAQAPYKVSHWGRPVNREKRVLGGHHFMTYKAIVRRDGVYANAWGHHDFNADLSEPLIKQIAGGWDRVFSRRIPSVLSKFAGNSERLLTNFHGEVQKRAMKTGSAIAAVSMLESHLPVYTEIFKDQAETVRAKITAKQRDINREFVPKITEALLEAYAACAQERGPGTFMRMKNIMASAIEQKRTLIFKASAAHVKNLLKEAVRVVRIMLEEGLNDTFNRIQRDYRSAVLGGDGAIGAEMSKARRQLRASILKRIRLAQWSFETAAGIDAGTKPDVALSDAGDAMEEVVDEANGEDFNGLKAETTDETAEHTMAPVKVEAVNEAHGKDKVAIKPEPAEDHQSMSVDAVQTQDGASFNATTIQQPLTPASSTGVNGASNADSFVTPGASPIGGYTTEQIQRRFHSNPDEQDPSRPATVNARRSGLLEATASTPSNAFFNNAFFDFSGL